MGENLLAALRKVSRVLGNLAWDICAATAPANQGPTTEGSKLLSADPDLHGKAFSCFHSASNGAFLQSTSILPTWRRLCPQTTCSLGKTLASAAASQVSSLKAEAYPEYQRPYPCHLTLESLLWPSMCQLDSESENLIGTYTSNPKFAGSSIWEISFLYHQNGKQYIWLFQELGGIREIVPVKREPPKSNTDKSRHHNLLDNPHSTEPWWCKGAREVSPGKMLFRGPAECLEIIKLHSF